MLSFYLQRMRRVPRAAELMKKPIQVPVVEITADLRSGVSDAELMKKYGLSEKGLKKVFEGLLTAASRGWSHIRVESDG